MDWPGVEFPLRLYSTADQLLLNVHPMLPEEPAGVNKEQKNILVTAARCARCEPRVQMKGQLSLGKNVTNPKY
jgi:hypothetical protein